MFDQFFFALLMEKISVRLRVLFAFLSTMVAESEKNVLEFSYSLLCPRNKIQITDEHLCRKASQLLFPPQFTLSFFNISGPAIMPGILYEGDQSITLPLIFDVDKNPVFGKY